MRWRPWPPLLGFLFLSALLVGSLWIVPYLPTNDGPEWVFASHIENHYSDPDARYPLVYAPALQFAGRGFTVLYDPFESWLGWQRGLQVALSLTVLLAAWGFVALVSAVEPRRWALGFLGFPLALSWELYMGFWAFVVGSGLGLLILALAVRLGETTWKGRALLSLLLFVQAVMHVFSAVLTGGALACLALARAPRGRRLPELGLTVLVGLPAAGILVAAMRAGAGATQMTFAQGFRRLAWRDAAAIFPQTVAPGSLARALVVLACVVVAAGVALARARKSETDPRDRGLGVAAALLLLASICAPVDVPGWQGFSQRFLPLGVALAFAVLPLEKLAGQRPWAIHVAPFVAATVWLSFSYPFHRRLAALCTDAFAGVQAPIHRTLEQFPVALEVAERPGYDRLHGEVPMMQPLLHMGALYATAYGGLIPFVFSSSPATYPFTTREDSPVRQAIPDPEHYGRYWSALGSEAFDRDPELRFGIEDELTVYGMTYEGIVVLGARPDDIALWHRRGFVTDWAQGTAFVAHFEPCSIDFTVPAAAADPPPLFDLRGANYDLFVNERRTARSDADGLVHFEIPGSLCGDVTLRAHWNLDGAPLGSRPHRGVCANADASGGFTVTISRASHVVACAGVVIRQ
ncbi:MAG: hypothetical protein ACLQVI_26450 [Polyangiaceae bacterium]